MILERSGLWAGLFISLVGGMSAMADRAADPKVPTAPDQAPPAVVRMEASLGQPAVLAGAPRTTFFKVGLFGAAPKVRKARPAVNLALVLDRSGSMEGDKIKQAREAARLVVRQLDERDVVSIITYDDTVQVLVPATRLTDRKQVLTAIDRIECGGGTGLFGGVAKGAAEVRKFMARANVSRVVLLSDGQANVGPSSPAELGALGASLIKEGITVSTIGLGLGYNEDLMNQLAARSDGTHAFVDKPQDLARVFSQELGDITSVVARDLDIHVELAPTVKAVRILGREAHLDGRNVYARVGQLYSGQETSLVIEVELPAGAVGSTADVGRVTVTARDLVHQADLKLASDPIMVTYLASAEVVDQRADGKVMAAAVELVANENNKKAMDLRDKGQVVAAKEALLNNAYYLEKAAEKYKSKDLDALRSSNLDDSQNLDPAQWAHQRKTMVKWQQQNRAAAKR